MRIRNEKWPTRPLNTGHSISRKDDPTLRTTVDARIAPVLVLVVRQLVFVKRDCVICCVKFLRLPRKKPRV